MSTTQWESVLAVPVDEADLRPTVDGGRPRNRWFVGSDGVRHRC